MFAALLALVGLSTSFAAAFSTQSEDIASFTTDVSISVPQSTVRAYYLTGADNAVPGVMTTTPPLGTSVNGKQIDPDTEGTEAQTDPKKMHSWQTTAIPAGGLVLNGPATAYVFQNGGDDPITAGLFRCATATTATLSCARIAGDASGTATMSGEVPISFGNISATVPAGEFLRLVVVNQGDKKFNLQWGFKDNRRSRLDLTVAT